RFIRYCASVMYGCNQLWLYKICTANPIESTSAAKEEFSSLIYSKSEVTFLCVIQYSYVDYNKICGVVENEMRNGIEMLKNDYNKICGVVENEM
ncbi:hypothetical protein BLOT_012338, partial [Blomia tropicalis]